MSQHVFYSTDNGRNERKVTILKVTGLVGRQPSKEKRINLNLRMPLLDNMGAPTWIDNAMIFVGKNHDDVTARDIDFQGYTISFSTDATLFGSKGFTAKSCRMRSFVITEIGGEGDNSEVVMEFQIRMPDSKARWNWLGQFNGEEVWARFIPGEKAEVSKGETEDNGPDDDDGEEVDEHDEDDASQDAATGTAPLQFPTKRAGKKKSGPADLRSFHEKQAGKKTPKKKK